MRQQREWSGGTCTFIIIHWLTLIDIRTYSVTVRKVDCDVLVCKVAVGRHVIKHAKHLGHLLEVHVLG